MDFSLSYELIELRNLVRRFVQDELMPLEKHVPREWEWEMPLDIEDRLNDRARELGLWSLSVPTEYGGAGLGTLGLMVVKEELGRTLTPWDVPGEPSTILYGCNEEQKERFLLPIIRGEKRTCFGQTEPDAGSDPSMMKTFAVRDGDDWVINGTKRFITGAHTADFVQLFAVTDPKKRQHGGITCFLVEKGTPGFSLVGRTRIMGRESPNELLFENCRVPHANVLGEVGQGFVQAQKWLSAHDRLGLGPKAIGLSERALEMAIDYSKLRQTFGKPLADRQAIQWMLADSTLDIHQCRLMVYHGAWKADNGQDIRAESSMVRWFCTEMQWRVIDRAIQIHGGIGLSDELPLAAMYQHVRSFRITGGASQIQRMIVARHALNSR